MSARHIALNRFGLGARPGEASGLDDPRGWLLAQLEGDPPDLGAQPPSEEETGEAFDAFRTALRRDPEGVRQATRRLIGFAAEESSAALATRAMSDRPFVERWIAFWSNHLCVSFRAGFRVTVFAGRYEREAIRAHALGRFEDMLLASARHPAMLLYLDNAQSVGPDSLVARRPGQRGGRMGQGKLRGLNENYARELLELHTVGVDGGYTQEDVVELARILTGWSLGGLAGPLDRLMARGRAVGGRPPVVEGVPSFRFLEWAHEPGRKTVLGKRYGVGEEAGEAVIRDLARRPETARFVSAKLVTHFVDDEPPAAAVDRLAARWMETEGDLREVARELVELDEAWDPRHRKFRTPQDWLVAILRSLGVDPAKPAFIQALRQLRQPLWAPPTPAGYSDRVRDWGDPDSLMNRAELARTLALRTRGEVRARGSARDLPPLETVVALEPDDPLRSVLADSTLDAPDRIALAFAGPAFQWR